MEVIGGRLIENGIKEDEFQKKLDFCIRHVYQVDLPAVKSTGDTGFQKTKVLVRNSEKISGLVCLVDQDLYSVDQGHRNL